MPKISFPACLFSKKTISELNKNVYSVFNIPVFSVAETDEGKKYKVLCFVFRQRKLPKLSVDMKNKPMVLFFDIALGGGTNSYFEDYKKEHIGTANIARIQYIPQRKYYRLSLYASETEQKGYVQSLKKLHQWLKTIKTEQVIINGLVSYPNLFEILDFIKREFQNSKVSVLGHDYLAICPYYTLMRDGKYCSCPVDDECQQCFASHKEGNQYQNAYACQYSIKEWRQKWGEFLATVVDEIIVFSQSGKDIFSKVYPQIENKLKVVPHQVPALRKCHISAHPTMNIVVLGGVTEDAKGMDILHELEDLVAQDNSLNLGIVGYYEPVNPKTTVTGTYKREDLPEIMEKLQADIGFIPSVCPETFSYTTSEAMLMGLPVACFDVGAPQERVRIYDKGLVISKIDAQTALSEMIEFITQKETKYA